jgi:hypothetical protein
VSKVLHGELTLQLFNPLIEDPAAPIYSFDLKAGDVTWFSPDIYQTHRYINSNSVTCTLQYIKSDGGEPERYRCYDDDNHVKIVAPIADMRFRDLLMFVREEYENELTKGTEDTEAIIADHKQFLEKLLAQTEGTQPRSEVMNTSEPYVEKSESKQESHTTKKTTMVQDEGSKIGLMETNDVEEKVPSISLLLPEKEAAVPVLSEPLSQANENNGKVNPSNIELTDFI